MWKPIKIWLCSLGTTMVLYSSALIAFECFINEKGQCTQSYVILLSTICMNGVILFIASITNKSFLIWINIIVVTGNIAVTLRTLMYAIVKAYFNQISEEEKNYKNIAVWLTMLIILSLCSAFGFLFRKYHYETRDRYRKKFSTINQKRFKKRQKSKKTT